MGETRYNDPVHAIILKRVDSFVKRYEHPQSDTAKLDDFDRLRTLGVGGFGRVMLIKKKDAESFYALKILTKAMIVKLKKVDNVIAEKRILQAVSFTYIVKIHFAFQDNSYLYIGLEFVGGGELFTYLRGVNRFRNNSKIVVAGSVSEQQGKLYACQIILAFEYLQALDIVYRDLKPENILIDPVGYLKMTDFGFAKRIKGRTYTLCGTPEYIAPEIIESKGYGFSVDWWSTGILIYEMLAGHPPFCDSDQMSIYEKICEAKFKCPPFFSVNLRDLLRNLIQKDLSRRYGNLVGGISDIKNHPWFQDINWLAILEKKIVVPYLPVTKGVGDASNFDKFDEEVHRVDGKDRYSKEFQLF